MTAGLWLFLYRFFTHLVKPQPRPEPIQDVDMLLQRAQQEMRENQVKNRERAVQAITQKNILQAELARTQKTVDNLQAKADLAASKGDLDLRHELLGEKQHYQLLLGRQQALLEKAIETTDMIKAAIRNEELRIRDRTAEAMALRTLLTQGSIAASVPVPIEIAASDAADLQRRLTRVLSLVEKARESLHQEARAALGRGDFEIAMALLSEQQELGKALIVGYAGI